ncbi:hypothetical protein [Collimonas sp.]|uniref:hypothetical protein n=1 Tax=Collimonas sp. TaxID=1963772 RepID=UPI002C44E550|nr:hypothetical protein [Collimonas sp.]HWW06351.1 hypothetical protein [Collimonas sp.]
MIKTQTKIKHVSDAGTPDVYNVLGARIPPDNFVVTRDKEGRALSVYGDLSWNRTPYDPDNRTCTFHFNFWGESEITSKRDLLAREMRWLIFVLIYLRAGHGLSNRTLQAYVTALAWMARFCESRSKKMQDVLSNPLLLIEGLEGTGMMRTVKLASLLGILQNLGPDVVGYDVVNKKTVLDLQKIARDWVESKKQHPPIPTRLYSSILSTLSRELDRFEHVAGRVLDLLQECARDTLLGRARKTQRIRRAQLRLGKVAKRPSFQDLLTQYDLENYWVEMDYAKALSGLEIALSSTMSTIALQIQAFTGMRLSEVNSLPLHCLDEVRRDEDDSIHYIVRGRVTKYTHGKIKRAQWVTSESGRAAIRLGQRISKAIYAARGETCEGSDVNINSFNLFPSKERKRRAPQLLPLCRFPALRARLQPIIQEQDLLELENIDPHRAWRSEERFQIGRPWTLTSHQLRRSLALYAQRSGLVTLPSLKRQLQHITQEMAAYYARGSAFATNFIDDGENGGHFGKDWQDAQPVSQFLSYAAHVLMTDDILFGVHPHWITNRLRDNDGILVFDRDVTLKRFQKGELAYQETLLGGCVKVGECNKNPMDLLNVDCLTSHCKNMVGNKKKLERVIAAQRQLVKKLNSVNPKSPEYRHEKKNLTILEATLANISNGVAGS